MIYEVTPYVSVGDIALGIGHEQLAAVLGERLGRTVDDGDGILEVYFHGTKGLAQIDTRSDRLVEVGFSPSDDYQVVVSGVSVFKGNSAEVLKKLVRADPGARRGRGGTVVLPALGVSLTGFDGVGRDPSMGMTAFARGYWDDMLDKMQPFSLE